jgi:N-acetylneuraminic acid mutarotase
MGGSDMYAIPHPNVEVYDPDANSCTVVSNMPFLASGIATVNNKIYAIGGSNGREAGTGRYLYLNYVSEYDPELNTWTSKASMPTPRSQFGIAVINDNIYVIGGATSHWNGPAYQITNAVEEYCPSNNTWTVKQSQPVATFELGAAALNGKIYTMGGLMQHVLYQNVAWTGVAEYNP